MANEKRLIDANAYPCNTCGISYCYKNCGKFDAWFEKTVDAVPVVHAHWEDGCAIHNGKEVYKSIDCSHCNDIFKIESHDREYWKKRFKVCPFCGAIMGGERRTNEPEEPV